MNERYLMIATSVTMMTNRDSSNDDHVNILLKGSNSQLTNPWLYSQQQQPSLHTINIHTNTQTHKHTNTQTQDTHALIIMYVRKRVKVTGILKSEKRPLNNMHQ